MSQLPDPDRGDMERRAIVAAALAVIVLLAYQAFFTPAPPPTEPKKEAAEEKPAAQVVAPQPQARSPRLVGAPRRGEREEAITLETDLVKVVLTNRGGGIRSWQLKQYQEDSGFVDLVGLLPDRSTPLLLPSGSKGEREGRGSIGSWNDPRSTPPHPSGS